MGRANLVSKLVENLVERTLVGDNVQPIPEAFTKGGVDPEVAYLAFLENNSLEKERLKARMSPDQQAAAQTLYQVWFMDYLKSANDALTDAPDA